MKALSLALAIIVLTIGEIRAQIGINTDNSLPETSAMLDVKSTNKGVLVPRLTEAQIRTITNPVNSLLVFCTTDNRFYAFLSESGEWKEVLFGPGSITPTCGLPFTDERDGKVYPTVQVGTQCWMGRNLNVGTRINGNQGQTANSTLEKYCINNLESNCDVYGGLYQWSEMMQYTTTEGVQGICPEDWHLPTDADFTVLTTYLGGLAEAGGKMKETGTVHWTAPNTGATDESGFTVLPGGTRNYVGGFADLNNRGSFWSSTVNTGAGYNCSYNLDLYYNTAAVDRQAGAMWSNGFSVRCLKD